MSAVHRVLAAAFALLACAHAARAADVPHLDLSVELDPATRHLHGVARFEIERDLRIRLNAALSIISATLGDKPLTLAPASGSGAARTWTIPVKRHGMLALTYDGTLPRLDAAVDSRSVLTLSAPLASPQGTFLPDGSAWYPRPAERFSYRATLTLPAGERGLVAGDLVDERVPPDATAPYRATFELKAPAEGIDLVAGPYRVDERVADVAGKRIRLRTYFTPDLADLAAGYLADSERYLALYAKEIGAYPYGSFSVVSSPLPTGFGMPTYTYLSAQILRLPFVRARSLGHEVLHNWWGNGVYTDYDTGNWSEGLTTFMADYAYAERESPQAARDMRLAWLRDLAAVPAISRMSLAQFRARLHGAEAAIGYGKGAMLFVMLRDLIGADAFERGVRTFWERNRYKVASWEDLQRAFEQAAGHPLQTFFAQWLRRNDAPRVSIAEATGTQAPEASRVSLALSQPDPPYVLRVPLRLLSGDKIEDRVATIDATSTRITLETSAKPDAVQVDPDFRVWRELSPSELPPILRQWIVARAPRYCVASPDPKLQKSAGILAQRLFEAPPTRLARLDLQGREPLLVIGLDRDIDALLATLKLTRPSVLPHDATAAVWTVSGHPGAPLAFVAVREASSLDAVLKPLPHYGAQSYVAFRDAKAISRGTWPGTVPAVPIAWR